MPVNTEEGGVPLGLHLIPQVDADTIFDLAFRRKEDLLQPNRLRNRILLWVEEEIRADALPAKAGRVLERNSGK